MKYIQLLSIAIILTFTVSVKAQDIHFSQFYMSPLNLNPAMTGVLNCKNRFIGNYRNQWAGVLGSNAYNTYSMSFDQKNTIGRDDYWGIGGTLWGDVAGEARYGLLQARVSGSYSKKMGGGKKSASYAVLGADIGVGQRKISTADLRWPSQITSTGFNSSLPGEIIQDNTRYYPDLSIGGLWWSVKDESNYWYLGAALSHVNRPTVSFLNQSGKLYSKLTVHGGAALPVANRISLLPFALYLQQGPHRAFNGGASARFIMGEGRSTDQSWEAGMYYRLGIKDSSPIAGDNSVGLHSDAIIFQTRFNYFQTTYGFSYDLNISKLAAGSPGNGAFEFSVGYQICGPEKRGVYCPRF